MAQGAPGGFSAECWGQQARGPRGLGRFRLHSTLLSGPGLLCSPGFLAWAIVRCSAVRHAQVPSLSAHDVPFHSFQSPQKAGVGVQPGTWRTAVVTDTWAGHVEARWTLRCGRSRGPDCSVATTGGSPSPPRPRQMLSRKAGDLRNHGTSESTEPGFREHSGRRGRGLGLLLRSREAVWQRPSGGGCLGEAVWRRPSGEAVRATTASPPSPVR